MQMPGFQVKLKFIKCYMQEALWVIGVRRQASGQQAETETGASLDVSEIVSAAAFRLVVHPFIPFGGTVLLHAPQYS